MSTPTYLAIDLETTGLVPSSCAILEIAAVVLDENFVELDRFVSAVDCPDPLLDEADHEVLRMHLDSGLIERLGDDSGWWVGREGARVSPRLAEQALHRLIDRFPKRPILLGQSVHFDRGFLREDMPNVERRLSHRMVDARTVMLLAPGLPWPQPKVKHVAEHDLDATIESLCLARRLMLSATEGWAKEAAGLTWHPMFDSADGVEIRDQIHRLLDELAPPVEGRPRDLMEQIKRALGEVESWPDRLGGGKVRPTTLGEAERIVVASASSSSASFSTSASAVTSTESYERSGL